MTALCQPLAVTWRTDRRVIGALERGFDIALPVLINPRISDESIDESRPVLSESFEYEGVTRLYGFRPMITRRPLNTRPQCYLMQNEHHEFLRCDVRGCMPSEVVDDSVLVTGKFVIEP